MAWPPHEDETLALFVGRDSLPAVIEHVTQERGGAPLHFLLAWTVAHLGFGLGGLRFVSALFAVASLPLVALLGLRLGGRRVALVATALVAPSWLFLFHGVYGRMYSVFLFCSLACSLALLQALERGGRARWALWVVTALLTVATHPYAVLLLAGQAAYVLVSARDRLKEAIAAGVAVLVLGLPFWLTDLVLVERFDVGVGGGGERLGGPDAVARYLWRSLGDATAGWWPVALAVLAAAVVGVVSMRRRARAFVLCAVGVTAAAFALARLGGSASPESRHLIYLAPLLAVAVATALVRLGRRAPLVAAAAVALLLVLEVAWAWQRTPALFEWEPDARQAARAEAEAWLATTSRDDDVLFGYEPLYLGAWERNRALPTTVVPRADSRLALRTLERAGAARTRRLGPRRERAEQHPAGARDRAAPARACRRVRGQGVRAVPRPADEGADDHAGGVPLLRRSRAPRRPVARDRRRRRQHPHRRARSARPARLRAVPALSLEQLAVARRALEGAEARLHRAGAAATRPPERGGDGGCADEPPEDE